MCNLRARVTYTTSIRCVNIRLDAPVLSCCCAVGLLFQSAMFAEDNASQSPEEVAITPPSHAWSGRYAARGCDVSSAPAIF